MLNASFQRGVANLKSGPVMIRHIFVPLWHAHVGGQTGLPSVYCLSPSGAEPLALPLLWEMSPSLLTAQPALALHHRQFCGIFCALENTPNQLPVLCSASQGSSHLLFTAQNGFLI